MQITKTTSCGLTALVRRATDLKSLATPRFKSNYAAYHSNINNKDLYQQKTANEQIRQATTSTSNYGPTSVARNKNWAERQSGGNLTVFEDSDHLPSLPIPNLTEALARLKEAISPIAMNSSEFAQALALIDKFSLSAGQKLDLVLRGKAEQTKNWHTVDWWTNEVYLKMRKPLVINSNPSMIYPNFPFEVHNQLALVKFVSHLVSSVIDFKLALIHGYNPEAHSADSEYRLDPNLCYKQYKHIFGSTRVPGEEVDTMELKSLSANEASEPFSLVLAHKGRFFEIQLSNVEDEKDRIEALSKIVERIIVSLKDTEIDLNGPGALTTSDRSTWSKSYRMLDADSLEAIHNAQFMVSIDTIQSGTEEFHNPLISQPAGSQASMAALGRQILHADSSNVGNRWFDKPIQLIVVADQQAERLIGAGINYEHTLAEGGVIANIIEYSFDKTVERHRASTNGLKSDLFVKQQVSHAEPAAFRQLRMIPESYNSQLADQIRMARQDYISAIGQFDLAYLDYRHYGSNAIKSWRFSPDSWVQVALQLGYYSVHKRLGPAYESASTRRFAYGRTETIRSLTKEVAEFCQEPNFETLKKAVESHKRYAILAGQGQAIDRPLMGYQMAYNELKRGDWSWPLPRLLLDQIGGTNNELKLTVLFTDKELNTINAFFNNELIRRSFKFALSTSQVSSVHPNIFMCYGPLLADGYGCCYNITGQKIVGSITANSVNQSFSCEVDKLNEGVQQSLDRMRDIVEERKSASKKC